MATINLYKIDENKHQLFLQEMSAKFNNKKQTTISVTSSKNNEYGVTLYLLDVTTPKDITWQWILSEFNHQDIKVLTVPKAVVLFEILEDKYAITFGSSFFNVDKFSDIDFGFNFARRINFKEIKTTALTAPNSKRNKTINTYVGYDELEFDSGESFSKIKGKILLSEDFKLFKPSVEIGNSIRFTTNEDSIRNVTDIIDFVRATINEADIINNIPVFSKVSNADLIAELEAELVSDLENNPLKINISELDIVGVTEVFNDTDCDYLLKYGRFLKPVQVLSENEIDDFCKTNNLDKSKILLDIRVVCMKNGDVLRYEHIKNLIDYTNEKYKCVLSNGKWYNYNQDYLAYLSQSISEIPVVYNASYDFDSSIHDSFVNQMYDGLKDDAEYQGLSETEIKHKLKRKLYAERAFNLIRTNDGFVNLDRETSSVDGNIVEAMDLYKDETMFAVKIGASSAKLCYCIDQSLTSLKLLKKGKIKNAPTITSVAIWLVLERKNKLKLLENGMPNLNELNMLMLFNRIDQWKKEVRLAGCKPVIYINYRQ